MRKPMATTSGNTGTAALREFLAGYRGYLKRISDGFAI